MKKPIIPQHAYKYYGFLKSLRSKDRRKMILKYVGTSDSQKVSQLNELVLWESRIFIKKMGKKCEVTRGKMHRFKLGYCYGNSVKMMQEGYDYIEGFTIHKKSGKYVAHAWNADKNGIHWDFTFKDPEEHEYFGILIPEKTVWMVGEKNGHIWYSVLPYIDDDFSYKEI